MCRIDTVEIILVFTLLGAVVSSAQTVRTWSGTAGTTNWADAGNWSGSDVPDTASEQARFVKVQPGLTANEDVRVMNNYTIHSLKIDSYIEQWGYIGATNGETGSLTLSSGNLYKPVNGWWQLNVPIKLGTNGFFVTDDVNDRLEINSIISQAAGVTAGLTRTGIGNMWFVNDNPPTFGGDFTVLSNSFTRWYVVKEGGMTTTFGGGSLVLDSGGKFELQVEPSTAQGGAVYEITNAIKVLSGGGTLAAQARKEKNTNIKYSGNIDLRGQLTIGQVQNDNGNDTVYSGNVTIDQNTTGTRGFFADHFPYSWAGNPVLSGNISDGAGSAQNPLSLSSDASDYDDLKIEGTNNTWAFGTMISGPGYVSVTNSSRLGFGNVNILPGGNLRLRDSGNLKTNARITVNNTAKLILSTVQDWYLTNGITGLGTVNVAGGTKTLHVCGCAVAPNTNNVPGTLTVNGSLSLDNGAGLSLLLASATSNSFLAVTGTVTLANALLDFAFVGGYIPTLADTITVLRATGTPAITGIFANDSGYGSVASTNGWKCHVIYNGGTGNKELVLYDFSRTGVGTVLFVR